MIDSIGWTLVHAGWQASIIAALVACALRLTRHATASARYVIVLGGLALTVVAPIATTIATHRPTGAYELIQPRTSSSELAVQTAEADIRVPSQRQDIGERQASARIDRMLPWLVAAWLLGIALLSARVLSGVATIHRLARRGAVVADERVSAIARAIVERLRIRSAIRVLQSAHADIPMVVGWLKPVVLVPVGLLASMAPAELEMLLAHELAHIRRYDTVVNLAQTIVETLLFFHPAVWWISARVREERENCCDDVAIAACGQDRLAYGAMLLRLEESRGTVVLAAAATDGSLLRRVRRIVVGPPTRVDLGATWFAGIATMVAVLSIVAFGGTHVIAARERPHAIATVATSESPVSSAATPVATPPRPAPASTVQPSSRSTSMRRSSVLAGAAALAIATTQISAQAPNLTGHWTLIPDATTSTGDWSDGRDIVIEQTDETLSIVHDAVTITFHVERTDNHSVVTKGPVRVNFAGFEVAIGPTADSAYFRGNWQGTTFNASTALPDRIRPAFGMMTFSLDGGELVVQTDMPAIDTQPAKHFVQRFRRP